MPTFNNTGSGGIVLSGVTNNYIVGLTLNIKEKFAQGDYGFNNPGLKRTKYVYRKVEADGHVDALRKIQK